MKKKLLSVLFFINFCLQATIDDQLFVQANSYFFNGEFAKARQSYEQLPNKNSIIWHNIGNCYYNEDNCTQALVCWKRAELGATFNQLGKLLELERTVLEKYHVSCDGVFMTTLKRCILGCPKIFMQLLLMLCFLLFLAFFYSCYIKKKQLINQISCNKRYFIILLISIISLLLLLAAREKFTQEKLGVVSQQKITVHIGPEKSFQQKMTLPQGCILQIVDQQSDMLKIYCDQGTGWIKAEDVEIV